MINFKHKWSLDWMSKRSLGSEVHYELDVYHVYVTGKVETRTSYTMPGYSVKCPIFEGKVGKSLYRPGIVYSAQI